MDSEDYGILRFQLKLLNCSKISVVRNLVVLDDQVLTPIIKFYKISETVKNCSVKAPPY